MAKLNISRPSSTVEPKQARALQTRETLLEVTAELLAEVGIERISTNMIAQRAGMTPPTFYRYFDDKFAVVEALGMRLMERQNAALADWIERYAHRGIEVAAAHAGDLLRETALVTQNEPGGVWVERALHATPRLEHIRIESHRFVADKLADAFAPLLPAIPREAIWRRMRIAVEFGYVTGELLHSEQDVPEELLLAETAEMLRSAFTSWGSAAGSAG